MPNDIAVRRASAADLDALNTLIQGSSAYSGAYRAMLDGYRITPEQCARDAIYLAERDGTVFGFYSLIIAQPELDLMFISDAAQGLGLGRLLFDHMRDTARAQGIETIKIVSHPPSEGFYLRMGAVRTGTRPPGARTNWAQPILEYVL